MDLTTTKESSIPLWKANETLWRGVEKACNVTSAGRLLALPVSVAESLINLTRITACFGERAFKGVANITAAPFTKKAKVWTGVKQLAGLIPTILRLPFLPLNIILTNLTTQTMLLVRGAGYARSEADDYERIRINAKLKINAQPGQGVIQAVAGRLQNHQAQQNPPSTSQVS